MSATTTHEYLGAVRRMIAKAGPRVGWEDPEMLAELVELHQVLDVAIREAVAGQRRCGITWASIGDATGTSKEAAVQKWAKHARRLNSPSRPLGPVPAAGRV